ncbi:MAG: hypothetical protein GXO47_05925 [Chlorobi bacterium]|nr:hypothetical protein [Chlorobiota bacterium]
MKNTALLLLVVLSGCLSKPHKNIEKIWLSYNDDTSSEIIINWESPEPGNSEVYLYKGEDEVYSSVDKKASTLHHVAVPVKESAEYRYKVRTGEYESAFNTFRSLPEKGELKVVVIADWGYNDTADFSNIYKENPDLVVTCGDNVPDLYHFGKQGDKHCINSYLRLVGLYPGLFKHIPFMPVMGNHDHQLYPRGPEPPADYMVYDTLGTAFMEFFELPGDEWKWEFKIPDFNLRLIGLDLHHIHDYGTNWQTCHAYHKNSPQYKWYTKKMSEDFNGYTVTLMNANAPDMRNVDDAIWDEYLKRNSAVITGSGYYAEKAIIDSVPFLNTSLVAGDVWPDAIDPRADYSESISTYILLTVNDSSVVAAFKTLDGKLYDSIVLQKPAPEEE